MMRSGKPPLARSPIRLRSRRPLQPTNSTTNNIQTTPVSLSKTQLPKRSWDDEKSDLRPEYHTISCELKALAKMVNQEIVEDEPKLGLADDASTCVKGNRSPLFERGRFYEEYSARRNERLKRKQSEMSVEKKSGGRDYLGVRVESTKKREVKKFESARKPVPATPLTERRYALRSSSMKENKKPLSSVNFETSSSVTGRKTVARRVIRK